jgi:uncharacterized membrane protein YciS (DUF1049 family)
MNSPNMSSSNYNFSSLPGRIYLHVMNCMIILFGLLYFQIRVRL